MVLIENADDSQRYKAGLYQLKTGKLIREFAPKGEGPNEFVSCQLDVRSNLSSVFYADDFMQNKYWECNLDSLIQEGGYLMDYFIYSREVIRLCPLQTGAKRAKKSPKAHTKTDTSSQEKLFGEIQNSF